MDFIYCFGRIVHSPVNPFEDNIPYSSYIKGNQVVGIKISNHMGKWVVSHIKTAV